MTVFISVFQIRHNLSNKLFVWSCISRAAPEWNIELLSDASKFKMQDFKLCQAHITFLWGRDLCGWLCKILAQIFNQSSEYTAIFFIRQVSIVMDGLIYTIIYSRTWILGRTQSLLTTTEAPRNHVDTSSPVYTNAIYELGTYPMGLIWVASDHMCFEFTIHCKTILLTV